jgi:hypothetical protein
MVWFLYFRLSSKVVFEHQCKPLRQQCHQQLCTGPAMDMHSFPLTSLRPSYVTLPPCPHPPPKQHPQMPLAASADA